MTVSRRASVPLTERVDGFLEEHTSEVKDIREEDRSAMSSSQEDRQKHPETIAKNRNHEKEYFINGGMILIIGVTINSLK